MKKQKMLSVLLTLTLVGCLAGCGNKEEASAPADNSAAQTQAAAENAEVLEENVDLTGRLRMRKRSSISAGRNQPTSLMRRGRIPITITS